MILKKTKKKIFSVKDNFNVYMKCFFEKRKKIHKEITKQPLCLGYTTTSRNLPCWPTDLTSISNFLQYRRVNDDQKKITLLSNFTWVYSFPEHRESRFLSKTSEVKLTVSLCLCHSQCLCLFLLFSPARCHITLGEPEGIMGKTGVTEGDRAELQVRPPRFQPAYRGTRGCWLFLWWKYKFKTGQENNTHLCLYTI